MKNYIKVLVLATLIFSGCSEDFLEISNPNKLDSESFWKTESDALTGLVGCYDALQSGNLYGGGPWTSGVNQIEGITDDAYWNWGHGFDELARGIAAPSNGNVAAFWAANYMGIRRANEVIANVPTIEMNEVKKARFIAEAKFIRALLYLNLSMTFRDVPLILEPQEVSDANIVKSPKSEITDLIISDLKSIISDLPNTIPAGERGRVSSGAALSLLARTYLYNNRYQEAADASKRVIDEYNYGIHPSYRELFSLAGEDSNEIILGVEFERGINEGQLISRHFALPPVHIAALPDLVDAYYCIDGLPISESPLFLGDATATPTLETIEYMFDKNRYMNRDPRMDVTLITSGSTWSEEENHDTHYIKAGVAFRKWSEEPIGGIALNYRDNALNFQIIRFADVLLMWAESSVMTGAYSESEVYDVINQIRQRPDVMMPKIEDVEGAGLSPDQLLKVIKHERRIELAYEMLRYYDLVRWEEREEVYKEVFVPNTNVRRWVEPSSNVWPIPQRDIDNNSLLEQHIEWK